MTPDFTIHAYMRCTPFLGKIPTRLNWNLGKIRQEYTVQAILWYKILDISLEDKKLMVQEKGHELGKVSGVLASLSLKKARVKGLSELLLLMLRHFNLTTLKN